MKWCICPRHDESDFSVPHVYKMPFNATAISRFPQIALDKKYKKAAYLRMDDESFQILLGGIWFPPSTPSTCSETNSSDDAAVHSTNDEPPVQSLESVIDGDSESTYFENTSSIGTIETPETSIQSVFTVQLSVRNSSNKEIEHFENATKEPTYKRGKIQTPQQFFDTNLIKLKQLGSCTSPNERVGNSRRCGRQQHR